ncbi:hypothetical protein TNCV_853891 [Trichonephila clavipes]|nr:hypothetical protein TNCV_853891 [Trichonephila clavipes]
MFGEPIKAQISHDGMVWKLGEWEVPSGNAFASEEEFCATEPLKACKFEVNEDLIPYTESKLMRLCK